MDFLKNINEEFVLTGFDFIKKNYHYIFRDGDRINYGEVRVKTSDINMQNVEFYIENISNIDEIAVQVTELMTKRLTKDAQDFKVLALRVVDAWEATPEKFKKQDKSSREPTYKNKGLLSEDEYDCSVFVHFDKISYHSDFDFTTGWGGHSYYDKDFYVKCLNDIDDWTAKVTKELASSKIRNRIKNYIMKNTISIPIEEIDKFISLAETIVVSTTSEKPPFPAKFTDDELNFLLDNFADMYLDEETVGEIKKNEGLDLTALVGWEISVEHEGYHHHDGQVCDYTATFTSPEGHEYYVCDSHSLMTGWNLYGEVEVA